MADRTEEALLLALVTTVLLTFVQHTFLPALLKLTWAIAFLVQILSMS